MWIWKSQADAIDKEIQKQITGNEVKLLGRYDSEFCCSCLIAKCCRNVDTLKVTTSHLKVQRTTGKACCRWTDTKVNLRWHNIKDADMQESCCYGTVQIDSANVNFPHVEIQLSTEKAGELARLVQENRINLERRAFDVARDDHGSEQWPDDAVSAKSKLTGE